MEKIQIKEVTELKRNMDREIAKLIAEFEKETGLNVTGIDYDVIDVSTVGEPKKVYLGHVRTTVSLTL